MTTAFSEPSCPRTVDELDELLSVPPEGAVRAIEKCPGDFLVLGAAGKMGFHLTRMLQRSLQILGRDDRVVAVSRFSAPESRGHFERFDIETWKADLSDARQLDSLPTAANVFFMAGVKFGTTGNVDLLYRMNETMPRLVASRFHESRIVALSTGCVYSFTTPESGGSNEQSETDPPGEYARSCLAREQAFIEGSAAHATRCALIRLNYSVELRYGVLVDIATRVIGGQPIDLSTPCVNVIWQRDAVAQILQSLPHASSPPRIINVTGEETLSVRDIAIRFGERFDRTPTFEGHETSTCWLSNSDLACGMFGVPEMTVEMTIDWIAEWLSKGRATHGKPTHFQVRDGNY
jgi:nucleoside-diphosphate-sugar epimerase